MFLNNRYHDPTTGTFLSVDPLVAKTGQAYLYANGNPTTQSDPSGLVGTSTVCTGVDGIGCVNNTTAKGFTAYTRTPNGDVISAVAHWQGWKPIDYTDEWVKANGNETEKRINAELHDCVGGDSDGECGRLAILVAGGSIDQANNNWGRVCEDNPTLCFQVGSASSAGVVDWAIEHRGMLATVAASGWCVVPGIGTASCAGAQIAALGVRSQQRGWSEFQTNSLDAAITVVAVGLGGVFSGEAAVTNAGAQATLGAYGYSKGQEWALRALGAVVTDVPIVGACFANHATRTGC